MYSGIYKITNRKNGRFYIGSAKNIEKRWKRHIFCLKKGIHENIFLQRSWDNDCEENFYIEVLEEVDDINLLLVKEQYFLDKLKPFPPNGYNIGLKSSGGDNLTNHPNRAKIIEKIKKSLKTTISNMTQDEKKVRWARFGEKNPNYGKRWNKDQKEAASRRMEIFMSKKENKEKTSKTIKKLWENEKYREKMTLLAKERTGNKNHFFGRSHSEETKNFLSKTKKEKFLSQTPQERYNESRQIRKVSIDGEIYYGLSESARQLGVCPATICFRIKSKNPKFINYKYID